MYTLKYVLQIRDSKVLISADKIFGYFCDILWCSKIHYEGIRHILMFTSYVLRKCHMKVWKSLQIFIFFRFLPNFRAHLRARKCSRWLFEHAPTTESLSMDFRAKQTDRSERFPWRVILFLVKFKSCSSSVGVVRPGNLSVNWRPATLTSYKPETGWVAYNR